MARGVVRLAEDEYVEWGTIVDAPVSCVMSRRAVVREFGEDRIARVDRNDTSFIAPPYTLADLLDGNRAGPGETCATLDEIRTLYRVPYMVNDPGPGPGHFLALADDTAWQARADEDT